jgi:hypothetical protein
MCKKALDELINKLIHEAVTNGIVNSFDSWKEFDRRCVSEIMMCVMFEDNISFDDYLECVFRIENEVLGTIVSVEVIECEPCKPYENVDCDFLVYTVVAETDQTKRVTFRMGGPPNADISWFSVKWGPNVVQRKITNVEQMVILL